MKYPYGGEFEEKLRRRMFAGALILTIATTFYIDYLFPNLLLTEWGFLAVPVGFGLQLWILHLSGELTTWIVGYLRSRR